MMRRIPSALIPALFALPSRLWAQCAMCGSAAASSPGVARGLAYSIFFLLGMLALVVAWLVLLVLRNQKPAGGRNPAAEPRVAPSIAGSAIPAGRAPAEE